MNRSATTLLLAGALRDAAGRACRDAAVACRDGRVLAAGPRHEVEASLEASGVAVDCLVRADDRLVVPALVNAHAHLDLTLTPAVAYGGDFVAWLEHVIEARPGEAHGVVAAVHQGLADSRAAGVGVVGDVAGSSAAIRARLEANAGLAGVSLLECFGMGEGGVDRLLATAAGLADFESRADVTLGLSPHAPYSVSPEAYDEAVAFAAQRGLPWQTHLAETPEEVRFTRDGDGPFADMLARLGRGPAHPPTGRHPVDLLAPRLARWPGSVVHVNVLEEAHVEALARCGAAVVYCPRAAAFFGHAGHRYRALLDAGVPVALGTDSALCHDTPGPRATSILEEMRLLHRRDGTPAHTLLRMATTHGHVALRRSPLEGELAADAPARFTAVAFDPDSRRDPLDAVLQSDGEAELIEP